MGGKGGQLLQHSLLFPSTFGLSPGGQQSPFRDWGFENAGMPSGHSNRVERNPCEAVEKENGMMADNPG